MAQAAGGRVYGAALVEAALAGDRLHEVARDLAAIGASVSESRELLLVLVEQRLRLLAGVLRGLEVLAHDRAALLDQRGERPKGVLPQDEERDEEDDQCPDHQPREGLDQVARVVGLGGRDDERPDHLPMKNATNDMSRA